MPASPEQIVAFRFIAVRTIYSLLEPNHRGLLSDTFGTLAAAFSAARAKMLREAKYAETLTYVESLRHRGIFRYG